MNINDFIVQVALPEHRVFAEEICEEMAESAKARGTGIAKRSSEYVADKMADGKAVIAFHKDGSWAGFCYIETWTHGQFVANSGLIVSPKYRKAGLAHAIKEKIFELSRQKYPKAKIFGLTTGLAVMKINSDLGYEPVTYSELTQDEEFWKGCQSCVNFEILKMKERKNCMCTAMLYDPVEQKHDVAKKFAEELHKKPKLYERFMRIKQRLILKTRPQGKKGMKSLFLMFSILFK
ncbi:GNAT family N-acetyltransferase [Pedobacter nyackensis]|uniref:GNAT family N-acetyltransferase n=1 Tax=Pedobacter nyackensis TaxID=475255 RepID=UPI0029302F1F|nr:GNAT family N-acetyltransferase [Pedobacter nyackensis]